MSVRSAVRRWGVPATALATIVLPLLGAGCPWVDDEDEWFSWVLRNSGCPEDCVDCYEEFMDYEDDEDDIKPPFDPPVGPVQPQSALPGGGDPGEEREGSDPRDTPPGTTGRGRVPDAVLRPKVDPHLGPKVPQAPSYPTGPKTTPTTKKY